MSNTQQLTGLVTDMIVRNLVVTGSLTTAETSGSRQSFIYTATGAEGASFVVAFPFSFGTTAYLARASGAGLADFLAFDMPASAYQVDRARIDCSAAPQAGDKIAITVESLS